MNKIEETKSTKIMKTIVVIVFTVAIVLGVASYIFDDNSSSNQKIIKQENPF